jgi:hypothetical protein
MGHPPALDPSLDSRRPWTVVATRIDGIEIEREIVGWRASRDEIATLRQEIELGAAGGGPS